MRCCRRNVGDWVKVDIKVKLKTHRPREVEREDDGIAESFDVEVRHIQGVAA